MTKHNFTIEEIFSSAWSKTVENAWFLFCLFIISLVLMSATQKVPLIGAITSLIVGIAITAVSIVIAKDEKPTFSDLTKSFKNYKISLHYIVASILYALIIVIGLIAFILPGIYLAIRLGFYKFLVIEHENMNAIDSLKESMRMTRSYFWKIVGFTIVLIIINILGAIPFGLGLILTIPVSIIASAILYKKLSTPHTEHVHTV